MRTPFHASGPAIIVLALSAFLVPSPAPATPVAGRVSEPLTLSATVVDDCQLNISQDMAFGDYFALSVNAQQDLMAQGSAILQCTPGTQQGSAQLHINYDGPNRGFGNYDFAMQGPGGTTDLLGYNLSWQYPASTKDMFLNVLPPQDGSPLSIPIYGDVGQAQNVATGSYNDSVTVEFSY